MRRRGKCLAVWLLPMLLVSGGVMAQDFFVYPNKGQSPDQTEKDKFDCYGWAKNNSGFDPMKSPTASAPPPQQEAPVAGAGKGLLGGAALGAGIGYLTGNTKRGAAVGGLSGGAIGGIRRNDQVKREQNAQQQWEQQQTQQYVQQRNNYNRAYSACLEARDYTVR